MPLSFLGSASSWFISHSNSRRCGISSWSGRYLSRFLPMSRTTRLCNRPNSSGSFCSRLRWSDRVSSAASLEILAGTELSLPCVIERRVSLGKPVSRSGNDSIPLSCNEVVELRSSLRSCLSRSDSLSRLRERLSVRSMRSAIAASSFVVQHNRDRTSCRNPRSS